MGGRSYFTMSRSMLSSFVLLIAVVVMSTFLTSVYLFSSTKSSRRQVHLIANGKYLNDDDDRLFQPHRLFDTDEEETRGDEWMKDFVLKGDIAQPHRQPAKAAVRKFDPGSASLPNSDDDYVGEEAKDGALGQIDEQEEEAVQDTIPKLPVDDKQYDDQASRFSERLEEHDNRKQAEVCQPLTRVAMIKTHKCSSSTLQNILLRKAEDLNLTLAIPKENVYFGSPSLFSRKFIFLDDGRREYDMMASHMRFRSPKDVQEVMKPGAKYITILRDPVKQFESVFTYYGWRTQFHADIHRFLQLPDRYFQIFEPKLPRIAGRNPMCYDNGLDARRISPDDQMVDGFISVLARWYDLVLIAEYFDESLILLKDLMCWTLDDVVYFSQNARNKVSVVSLTRGDQAAIRSWNWADQKLYDHFNATLWEKIKAYGRDRMREDLDRLTAKKAELSKDCIGRVVKQGDKRMWYPRGIKVNSFLVNENAVNKHLCEQLTRPELVFLGKFRENLIKASQRKWGIIR